MDRRNYLKQMTLVAGGILIAPRILVSCNDKAKNLVLDSSLEPFRTLEEIRHFVRLSGGHLKLEMERLIKKKDAEAIFNFVNERFVSIPGHPQSVSSNAYEVRWGQEGMLRCGKGTLREKSDLLYFMLSEAGFNPSFHRANFLMTPALVQGVFCRNWNDNDEIEVDEAYLEKWDAELKPTDTKSVTKSVDPSNNESKKLALELSEKLPSNFLEDLPHIDWLDIDGMEVPVVRIVIDGSAKDLNFVEKKKFTEFSECEQDLYDLKVDGADIKLDKLRVILHATFSNAMNKPIEIARGEWEMSRLFGNQIAVQCVSTIPQEALMQTTIKDVQQFVPILSLQDPSIPEKERINYSFKGVGFDLMGNTFQEDGDGAIRMNGLKLNDSDKSDTRAVRSLKAELLDDEYPTIKLKCAPLDAEGKTVVGLSGSAFEIIDQNKQQIPVVLQNSITTRVLVFFDCSASMPYPYAAKSIPEETIEMIYAEFEKVNPTVVVEKKMFQLEFLKDLRALELKRYDHVVCIGDGEAFEEVSGSELKEIVGDHSISYHYINNGSSRQSPNYAKNAFEGASLSFFEMENLEDNIGQICGQLTSRISYPYLLSYEAPYEGDDMIHPVSIGISGNNNVPKVKERYVVNRERKYTESSYPCGISITLDWDDDYTHKSITKHVAGYNAETEDVVLPKHKEEVRAFALGTHRFFFEPDKATLPVLLDQSLSSQLSVAPYFEDQKANTNDQLEQINAFQVLPSAGNSIFAPLPQAGEDWVTFENNFQTCLYSEYINFDLQKTFKRVDVWETSDVRTFAKSKQEAFTKTLETTSKLALSESSLFEHSTFSEMNNKSSILYSDGDIDFQEHPDWRPLDSQSYTNHLIYDRSFSTSAYWKINKSTGALIGIMSDGSGGGIEAAIAHNLKIIDSYAGAYNKAAAPFMSDPLAFGTVTMYGQFLARLYGLVCVAILSLDAAKLPADSRKAIKKLAYGVIKSFAFAKFGKLKQFEKILDKLFDPGWPKIG